MTRRGATEEPVPDYLDTARDQDPRNEETRLSADACRRSAETGRLTPYNRKESK